MKKLLLSLSLISSILITSASPVLSRGKSYGFRAPSYKSYSSGHVRGYTKRSGRYVMPHRRSRPDGRKFNNWSTRGNINPYTGKKGYKRYY